MNTGKIIKAVSMCLTAVILTGALAGCGKSKVERDENGKMIISVGGWATSEGKLMDSLNERKARYEAENTDAVIEGEPWQFDRSTFYAQAEGGQLPILFSIGYTEMPEIISSEYSSDLTDILKNADMTERLMKLL